MVAVALLLSMQLLRVRSRAILAEQEARLNLVDQNLLEQELKIEKLLTKHLLSSAQDPSRIQACILQPTAVRAEQNITCIVIWDADNTTGALNFHDRGVAPSSSLAASSRTFTLLARVRTASGEMNEALVFSSAVPTDFHRGVLKFTPQSGNVVGFALKVTETGANSLEMQLNGSLFP
ncbi:MAG: hypothetical protein J6386_21150 [Candidatus Synoicihabitans palmerolidicus]|nr:hypothetical protein [Candidatus Synoicihabitans palmerolidicus]